MIVPTVELIPACWICLSSGATERCPSGAAADSIDDTLTERLRRDAAAPG